MPKHIIFFRDHDHIKGPMETTFIPHEGNTPDEVLAGCKRLFPFGSHFRVYELVNVTPKTAHVGGTECDECDSNAFIPEGFNELG